MGEVRGQSGRYYMYYLDRNYRPSTLLRAESPNEIGFDFDNAVRIEVEGEQSGYRCPHVFIDSSTWYMYYGFKYKKRAGYAASADGLHWNVQNTAVIEGHDPEILRMADDLYLLFYCPTKYNMGHKPGCDIRVAVFEGNLNELAQTEPRTLADTGKPHLFLDVGSFVIEASEDCFGLLGCSFFDIVMLHFPPNRSGFFL